MKMIWKYPVLDRKLLMQRGAKILHVADQGGVITMWAEVDPEVEAVRRNMIIVGTGERLALEHRSYIGTVMQGEYVWHLYIQDETPDPARPA